MRVLSPGKLVLTGAYAVLDGAPAIVMAVDRYAIVELSRPGVADTRALQDEGGHKLGLGSSAACAVALAGARAAGQGRDLRAPDVRAALFAEARGAHARSQGGGSGVDVAAAVHGGVLRYALSGGGASVAAAALPAGLTVAAFWSGSSARTSDLLARVADLRAREPGHACFGALSALASEASASLDGQGQAARFVGAASRFGAALDALGHAADAPIVPAAFADLGRLAAADGAAFLPSGAGGGDVAVWLGLSVPPPAFFARAASLGMKPLSVGVDRGGVRLDPPAL